MSPDPRVPGWNFKRIQDKYHNLSAGIFLVSLLFVITLPRWYSWMIFFLAGLIFGLVVYFFRDPNRSITYQEGICYSPADGKVSDIDQLKEYDQEWVRVGIFMSVLDVHVQRAPLRGRVDFINHQAGKHLPAYHPQASFENDRISMGLLTKAGLIITKQIAGILARTCVNYAEEGKEIQTGQRFGLIKFGSRVELYLPPSVDLLVAVGDQVRGGLTPIAEIVRENN